MRSRLLQSALQLVARKGVTGISIDEVIRAARVSRGTFYNYFPSAEALVREVATEITQQLARIVEPALRSDDDPVRAVALGIRLATRVVLNYPAVADFLVRVGWPGQQAPTMLEFVRDDIEEGVRQGRFRRMPMAIALNIVVGAVLGAIQRMQQLDSPEDCSQHAAASALRALGIESRDADKIAGTPPVADENRFIGALADTLGLGDT